LGAVTFSAASPTQPDCAETQISCKYYPEETLEVAAIVAEIRRLTASENPLSIGILCRARRHLPDLLKALTEAGISTQGTDIFPLAKEPIIQDLMSLHRVLLRPSDRLAWFSLMRSPMIGALLTTLEFFAEESNLAQAICERSESNVELARLHSAIHWASSKLYEYPLCEVIEGCWVRLGGMDAYSEDKIHHAMRWFELLEAQGSNGYDYEQVNTAIKELYTQTTQTAQVQVMTVHKSKGLEFDYVFLPFLSKQLVSDKASLMLWQPSADGLLVGVEGDDIHSWLKYEEKIRSENEKKRLLYVACTRAKKGLFISFSMHPDKSPIGLAKYLGDYAQEADSSTLTLKQACQSKVKSSLDNVQTQATRLYHLPRDYETKISSIELDSDLVESTLDLVDDNPASNPFELALGNLVHRALAWLGDTNAIAKGNLSSIKGINSRLQFWLEQAGVDRNYWPELKEETLKHIKITLASDQGQWILESHENAYCEWPLTGVVGNSVKHLVLDRCFESRQNIWIVDYKSSTPEGNEKQESFFASECERYRQQLTDYKTVVTALYNNDKPVRIGLFFTGLGVLKEL
jgi:ATP-dependent exoDNAse (exonuclease V) beta subunit